MGKTLGRPHDVQSKLVGLEGQFQPSPRAHRSPDSDLLWVEWLNGKAPLTCTVH